MISEYRYERLNDENIIDLLPLYFDAFRETRTLKEVKAKFNTSVFGVSNIAIIAYDQNNTVAAFYALFPANIVRQGKSIIAAQVGDLMTHSNHRRKGLFLELASRTHALAVKDGIEMIFTIPYGENSSYRGFIEHLKFRKLYSLSEYEIKTNTLPIAAMSEKINWLKIVYAKFAKVVLSKYEHLTKFSERANDDNDIVEIQKDEQFFEYKMHSNTYLIKLGETEFWFKIKKGTIMVGDIRNLQTKAVPHFVKEVKWLCFLLGIRVAQFDVAPNSVQNKALSSLLKPSAFHYQVLVLNSIDKFSEEVSFCLGDLDSF